MRVDGQFWGAIEGERTSRKRKRELGGDNGGRVDGLFDARRRRFTVTKVGKAWVVGGEG